MNRMSFVLMSTVFLMVMSIFGVSAVASEKPGCQAEIEWDVAPEAKVGNLACELGKHKKDPALIFTADLTNTADKPLRFRLNIFLLDMDKGAGHLVPRKGKPPVIEPGKTETVKIPFIKTDKMSKKIFVVVKTLQ